MPRPGPVHPVIAELAELRRSRGLGRIAAAHRAGLATHTVERWELGYTSPTLDVLTIYAASLGRSLTTTSSQPTEKESTAA